MAPTPNPYPLTAPPTTPKTDQIDDYHGTLVPDPYRWLEDATDPQVQEWTRHHNIRTREFLDQLPALPKIKARMTTLWNFAKFTGIHKTGGRYFISKNDGLQNQSVIYQQDALSAEPTPMLDPNALSADGTIAVFNQAYSKDGNLLAYSLSSSGSDWQEIHLMDTTTGEKFTEVLKWCKFSGIGWKPDNRGFFYNRLTQPEDVWGDDTKLRSQVWWHAVDTPQTADELIYENPNDPGLRYWPFLTSDKEYLVLHTGRGTDRRNGIFLRPTEGQVEFQHLVEDGIAKFNFVGNQENIFYFLTDLDTPNGRLVAIDIKNPTQENWREIIPEGSDAIASIALWGQHFIVKTNHHAHNQIKIYDLAGQYLRDILLPTMGTVGLLEGDQADPEFFISFESFLFPRAIFRYDLNTAELSPLSEPSLDFDPAAYETNQVFYASQDGTQIPMFLTHKKGLEKNGNNPTILYAYGGFTLAQTPIFNVWNLVWLEMGGTFALAGYPLKAGQHR